MKKFIFYLLSFFIILFIGCKNDNMEIDITEVPETDKIVFQHGDIFIDTFEQTKLSRQEGNKILNELKKHVNMHAPIANIATKIIVVTVNPLEITL